MNQPGLPSLSAVDSLRLDRRVAIVTGASSGLGVEFALALVGAGARVVLAARRHERLATLAKQIEELGGEALVVSCDVNRDDDIQSLVDQTLARFGSIDVLVNNAGVSAPLPAEAEDVEHFRRIIETNLTSVFRCSRACGTVMLKQGSGVIVNVASVLGIVASGLIPQASYAASKAGVVNLTRELAAQWARRGVRVNALAPGWFPSEMTEEMFDSTSGQSFIRKRTPMGRAGRPEEVSGALLFLASDASTFVTGQVLAVDGGWTIV